jgi:hypothetical protein
MGSGPVEQMALQMQSHPLPHQQRCGPPYRALIVELAQLVVLKK